MKKRNSEDENYNFTNREKSKKVNKSLHYCSGCDANLVSDVGRCFVCGKIGNKKKSKY